MDRRNLLKQLSLLPFVGLRIGKTPEPPALVKLPPAPVAPELPPLPAPDTSSWFQFSGGVSGCCYFGPAGSPWSALGMPFEQRAPDQPQMISRVWRERPVKERTYPAKRHRCKRRARR